MLRSLKELLNYQLKAENGKLGHIIDFYFDDQTWLVNFLVADTGTWFPGKKVLISPAAFYGSPDRESKTFPLVYPDKEMIKTCPDSESRQTVSFLKREELDHYKNWPAWMEKHPDEPPMVGIVSELEESLKNLEKADQTRLRSMHEVIGYHVQTTDNELGHVHDLIVDEEEWMIRFFVCSTGNLFSGQEVMVIPVWVKDIQWAEKKVTVDLSETALKDCPNFDADAPINKKQEEWLFDYFGHPKKRK